MSLRVPGPRISSFRPRQGAQPPRRAQPFPTGKPVVLVTCPTCKLKGLVIYNAPTELGYVTACEKCGRLCVVHRDHLSLSEIQHLGGFTPGPERREVQTRGGEVKEVVEGDILLKHAKLRLELGAEEWQRRGHAQDLFEALQRANRIPRA